MSQEKQLSPEAKADIQGFITSAYGHLPFSAYLFLEIIDRLQAQVWLSGLLPALITAASWRLHAGEPKAKPERALNIALTYAGLEAFGLSEASLHTFPTEFREGMASPERTRILNDTQDSAPSKWEVGGPQNEPVHLMLILHAQSHSALELLIREIRQAILAKSSGVEEHEGCAQFGARPESGREQFGFFDGVAQPQIEGIKGTGVRTGEFILGYLNEYAFYPVSPLVPDVDDPEGILPISPNPFHAKVGYRDLGLNGSYVVYRKLAQDVAGFWHFLHDESIRLRGSLNPGFILWLAAKMVGRWPSGAPLILAPDSDNPDLRTDNFLYAEEDPYGLSCPFGAHIRRTNPRDQIGPAGPVESLHMSARHRILRRGKPYGPPLFDPALLSRLDEPEAFESIQALADDGVPRGIHFLCANASIRDQFEFIQQAWADNPSFSGLVNNRDPLIGNNDPTSVLSGMLVPGRHATMRTSPLPRFVTVRGGAYLFMPSLTALRYLTRIQ
jgi:Dyp-type peroxidase family